MEYGDTVTSGIIRLLSHDGRASNKSIATAVGTSEPTIAARIRSLVSSNVIRVVLQQDTHRGSATSVAALVEFYVDEPGKMAEVSQTIAGFDEVFSAYETARRPDIVAHCRAESPRALNATILHMAERVPYISQIHTLPILDLGRYSTTLGALKFRPEQQAMSTDVGEALIALLQKDGRRSVSSLARQLGLSVTAVRHRLGRLLQRPGVRIGLVCDSEALGYTTWFDVRASIMPAHLAAALERFSEQENVRMVAHLSGPANLALFLLTHSLDEVDQFVRDEIRPLKGLIDFTLMRVPRVFKHDYNYNL